MPKSKPQKAKVKTKEISASTPKRRRRKGSVKRRARIGIPAYSNKRDYVPREVRKSARRELDRQRKNAMENTCAEIRRVIARNAADDERTAKAAKARAK